MKTIIFLFALVLFSFALGWGSRYIIEKRPRDAETISSKIIPKPLDKYTIENLAKTEVPMEAIAVGEILKEDKKFTSHKFFISLDPTISGKEKKRVSGLVNIPVGDGPFPAVVMLRGYVDQKVYQTGTGTQKAGEVFARNGFLTIAPDFLGYGESDKEAENIFEARFQTYTTALALLKTISASEDSPIKHDGIFIWGHSNGGQIALTILEIIGANYPTTLWAPVSKPFPYSILYYTDESDDRGQLIRRELAEFEKTYNPDLYSLDLYLNRIQAPLQLHQGTRDDAVPQEWSDDLARTILSLNLDLNYYIYPGADHNLRPSWDAVVSRDLQFFRSFLD